MPYDYQKTAELFRELDSTIDENTATEAQLKNLSNTLADINASFEDFEPGNQVNPEWSGQIKKMGELFQDKEEYDEAELAINSIAGQIQQEQEQQLETMADLANNVDFSLPDDDTSQIFAFDGETAQDQTQKEQKTQDLDNDETEDLVHTSTSSMSA